MARSLARRIVGRLYWALPRDSQARLRAAAGPALRRVRLRSVVPAPPIAADARRPVSIVIPSYDDVRYLVPLLRSIHETCAGWDYEVIVVDDHATEAARARLRPLASDRVRLVLREERGGFAKAVNSGLAVAANDVVLLNSDIVALPGWLDALQRAVYDGDPRIGMASGMLMYPDGLVQYGGTYHTRSTFPQWFGHLWVGRPAGDQEANVPAYIRAISGACVYVRRDALDAIGGLDETYWLGFEDVDWGLRAWRAGWRCWYAPAAKLIHHESATRGYSQGRRELASMRYFWERWRSGLLEPARSDHRTVAIAVSDAAPALWRDWVDSLVPVLGSGGRAVSVTSVGAGEVDEEFVARCHATAAIPIAADPGAVPTAWLAAESLGLGLQLLPGGDPSIGASETATDRAQWRPEFDFIAPSASVGDRVTRLASWRASAVIAPALAPRPVTSPPSARRTVVLVGPVPPRSEQAILRIDGVEVHRIRTERIDRAVLDAVAAAEPRVVVCFMAFEHALAPLALAGLGGAFVGAPSIGAAHEVMDGYNALLVDPERPDRVLSALRDLLERDDVVDELEANARRTASAAAGTGPRQLALAIAAALERR